MSKVSKEGMVMMKTSKYKYVIFVTCIISMISHFGTMMKCFVTKDDSKNTDGDLFYCIRFTF